MEQYGDRKEWMRLGSGATGTVYRARNQHTGQPVVIKEIPHSVPHAADLAQNEAKMLSLTGDKCQVYFVCLIALKETETAFYVIESYLEHVTDLDSFLHSSEYNALIRSQPAAVLLIARDILRAVATLHDFRIAHRDIKPANILVFPRAVAEATRREVHGEAPLASSVVRLIDFGFACAGRACEGCVAVGTISFIAPEILDMQRYCPFDLFKWSQADIWSTGLVVFELLNGVSFWSWLLRGRPETESAIVFVIREWITKAQSEPNEDALTDALQTHRPELLAAYPTLGLCLAQMINLDPDVRWLPLDMPEECRRRSLSAVTVERVESPERKEEPEEELSEDERELAELQLELLRRARTKR